MPDKKLKENILEEVHKIISESKPKKIIELLKCYRQEILDEVRKGLPREKGKTGLVKMIFGDGHKDEIPVESNYDYGYNSYRQEVLELLNKLK